MTPATAAGLGADLSAAEVGEVLTGFGAMYFAGAPMLILVGIQGGDGRSACDARTERMLDILMPAAGNGARSPS